MRYLPLILALACRSNSEAPPGEKTVETGVIDCVPVDETCNGEDDDCDGEVDEAGGREWFVDGDGDSYGSGSATVACVQPSGTVDRDGDCDDANAQIYPSAPVSCSDIDGNCDGLPDNTDGDGDGFLGCEECDDTAAAINPNATEICDSLDNNCDGGIDVDATDAPTWYADTDGDGHGDLSAPTVACEEPLNSSSRSDDCDDTKNDVYPGAEERCDGRDNDCDGAIDINPVDASVWYTDADGDGFGDPATGIVSCQAPLGLIADSSDCNDIDASISPAATEICNGLDDDCDALVDDADSSLATTNLWYQDRDSDGYGDVNSTTYACVAPPGYVGSSDDCDDRNATIHPGVGETCDGKDQDCNGIVDDNPSNPNTYYADADGDIFGDASSPVTGCTAPAGTVSDATDCDDAASAIHPGAAEICDGLDNDCDARIDDADPDLSGGATWYIDYDGDGYGAGSTSYSTVNCQAPAGYSATSDDCNDRDAAIFPGAVESCDGVDEDCDGTVDNNAIDPSTFYADADGDSYGDPLSTSAACTAPSGYVSNRSDCDDSDVSIHPKAGEFCNGYDDDCDGLIDDADADRTGGSTWYIDYDADTYGSATYTTTACQQPSGYVANTDDCNDRSSSIYPGANEYCNGADDNCDGTVDEASALDAPTWYRDADADSYGDPASTAVQCDAPVGYLADSTDCDDTNASIYPGAREKVDGLDNDCDGQIDDYTWVGTGNDGPLVVTGTTDLSADASNGRTAADAVAYPVTAISSTVLTTSSAAVGIASGDEVLVINLHGSDAAYAAVGRYEFLEVASVNSNSITLASAPSVIFGQISNADISGQSIVVQRVPQYTDVTIGSVGLLTTSAWSGSTGGLLAFRATGTVIIAAGGSIAADELGYAGGATGTCLDCDAYQGESYAGSGDGNITGGYGYNQYNGAWAHNYGGGGALVTGGGGNHAGGATGAASWNGGSASPPEAGTTYGSTDLSRLFPGSGGGGVWHGQSYPGPGGDGGGILYVAAATITASGSDALTAMGGTTPYWATGSWTYGAGGGAGGSIYLIASDLTLASNSVDAGGGYGESTHIRRGGDGGYGRVRVDYDTVNGSAYGSGADTTALRSASYPAPGYTAMP